MDIIAAVANGGCVYGIRLSTCPFNSRLLNVKVIFAPWRMAYIKSKKPSGCVFCKDSIRDHDLVLYEGKTAFVMMNRYPYITGHLMIIPVRHISKLEDMTSEEKKEMFDLTDTSVRVLKEGMKPEGFNIGMNLGKAAGAGVDDHIHIHVVPRWNGDTNSLSVIGEVRVISEDLTATWKLLLPYFRKYQQEV